MAQHEALCNDVPNDKNPVDEVSRKELERLVILATAAGIGSNDNVQGLNRILKLMGRYPALADEIVIIFKDAATYKSMDIYMDDFGKPIRPLSNPDIELFREQRAIFTTYLKQTIRTTATIRQGLGAVRLPGNIDRLIRL